MGVNLGKKFFFTKLQIKMMYNKEYWDKRRVLAELLEDRSPVYEIFGESEVRKDELSSLIGNLDLGLGSFL